jgi:hypothetical protein
MAATRELERPRGLVDAGVGAVAAVEAPRAIGLLGMPAGVKGNVGVLLGMDSNMLGNVYGFAKSVAPFGIGLGMLFGALGMMAKLI